MPKMLMDDNYHDFQLWKEGKLARVEFLDTPFNIYRGGKATACLDTSSTR